MVVFGTRWKGKGSEAFALSNPMSKIVSRLQNSLTESKAFGLLLDRVVHCDRYCAVHLEVELEQANLLDQACFGCHIVHTCLEVVWRDKCLENDELWEFMTSRRKLFPIFYKAYSHLRAKNWVVKSEIKYGVDFVAYHHHPSLVHSEYAVIVLKGNEDITRLMAWPSLHATLRLEDGVAKTLLLLHINNVHNRVSPSCFEHYTVEEQIIARWNPEQCHEEHTTSDNGIETFCDAIHHVQRSPHYHFNKFSVCQNLTLTSPSPMMVDLNTRWKGKGSKAIAFANPMSKIVAQLQSSLSQSKACGLLAGFAVLLQVGLEQADLLNRACFGHPIITDNEDNQWYELSLEEAFYLYHSLKCLEIVGKNHCFQNIEEVWQLMKSKRALFPISYKAYSHSHGKQKLGCEVEEFKMVWTLWPLSHHPSLVHSESIFVLVSNVIVVEMLTCFAWPDLHATVSLEGGVAKTLLVIHIEKNGCESVSSSCLKHCIEEQTVTDGVEQCRENKKFFE
ncbi:hypothetical protein IFM89_012481 [Coptis chinensis]|uniref:tRNA-intron lyase n=1 Tax=Coptis chinensis TaxID=261450 RepID=A0A835M369_9MAGN|nr:hypothetical protein IFM89_012481 [Coptis chinensis]